MGIILKSIKYCNYLEILSLNNNSNNTLYNILFSNLQVIYFYIFSKYKFNSNYIIIIFQKTKYESIAGNYLKKLLQGKYKIKFIK